MSIPGYLIQKYFSGSKKIYNFCKNYTNNYDGQNNHNINTNGELKVINKLLPKCKTVFDIGANIGEWTTLALKTNPELSVHCFEPSKNTYQKLISNNFSSKVFCNNLGLSSSKKQETLYIFNDNCPLNSMYKRVGLEYVGIKPPKQKEIINLETLDNYCQENNISQIDFAKIDVEGHELEVLKGGTKLLKSKKIKIIQFEYGGCNIDSKVFLKDIFSFFKEFDYDLYKIYPDDIKHIKSYSQKLENFQYQNWLAGTSTKLLS